MKTLQDLNITFFKPKNKEGNDCIKDALYALNDIVYTNSRTPLSNRRKERILEAFIRIGKELSATDITDRCKAKKDEILGILRTYCRTLQEYKSDDSDTDLQRVTKYAVSQYLRGKEEINTPEAIIKQLDLFKDIEDDYTTVNSLTKAKDELLDSLKRYYRIN